MDGENTYLTKSAFAAQQGWSPSYITKLKDQERLVLSEDKKLVNVEATLALLGKTRDPGKDGLREFHAAARLGKYVEDQDRLDKRRETELPGASNTDPKYWDAKARREQAMAEQAELDLAKKLGEHVERKRVEAMSFAAGRMTRDAVLGLTPRLAAEFAAMTDAFEIEIKLRDALKQVFANVATMTADDMEKAIEPSH